MGSVSLSSDKILSFGSQGSGQGQLHDPWCVAVNEDNNILVVGAGNDRIQNFTSDGQVIMAMGKRGSNNFDFNFPL